MKYRLIVVTHGGDTTTPMLRDTLASFHEMVTPRPAEAWLVEDGPPKRNLDFDGLRVHTDGEQQGFCRTVERAWAYAGAPGPEFVYWLEHDFQHRQPVNLLHLARVLLLNPGVAQMSLMRQPVNADEKKAGGVVALRPDGFLPKITPSTRGGRHVWLEQGLYWTTNPSLFRSEFARAHQWPGHLDQCEGRFSIHLREKGYSFGVWGDGTPWVEHVGVRTGTGY